MTLVNYKKMIRFTYQDIIRFTTNMLDGFHWLDSAEVFDLKSVIIDIKNTAVAAVDEYEKVVRIRENTEKQIKENQEAVRLLLLDYSPESLNNIDAFVTALNE